MTRRYIVRGRVQGVGFRAFARRMAEAFDIGGSVRNMPDDTVEIIASGSVANLRSFREQIEIGPSHGRVDEIIELDMPEQRVDGFRIVH